jgi:hypothetical protein
MGLVGVHVLTEAQIKEVAAPLLKRYQLALEKHETHVAQCEMDESRLTNFASELAGLEPAGIRIVEIDDIQVEILRRKQVLQESEQPSLTDPILADGALANELVAALPAPLGKTDADGRFTVGAGEGDWLIAGAQRELRKGVEEYLWIVQVPAQKAPILISNDSLVNPRGLLTYLSLRSGMSLHTPTARALAASADTEAWIKGASERAVRSRAKTISDRFEAAKLRYKNTLASARPEILEKWGGEEWRKLQIEVASIDVKDPLAAAEQFLKDSAALDGVIEVANTRETQAREFAEQERLRVAAEERIAAQQSTFLAEKKAKEQRREAEERAERARVVAAQEAERVQKARELEILRNTPVFEGTCSIVTSQFCSFEFGFGFWAESSLGGAKLRIFLNGKQPGVLFGGDKPDAEINIDNRLRGSETYSSGGHDFQIEWDKPSKMSWSPKIVVRRLN